MLKWMRMAGVLLVPALVLAVLVLAGCKSTPADEEAASPLFPQGTSSTPIDDPHVNDPAPDISELARDAAAATPPPAVSQAAEDVIVTSGTGGPTKADVAAAKKAGTRHAVIQTARGPIEVALYGEKAPITVASFVKLATKGFYDGLTFHRVENDADFTLIQGGDPNGNGTGGPGYTIKLEAGATELPHERGTLAMARSTDPDSAGCQFYICRTAIPRLDGQYAVFGKVTRGIEVADKIQIGDKITSITIK